MTLKEFSLKHLPVTEDWRAGHQAEWRKVFPTRLRVREEQVKAGYYKGGFLGRVLFNEWVDAIYKDILEEEWERIHLREIIDTEWRPVFHY